jgi:predicted oxidoreductase (fatty acid repression mutant protein)
VTNVAACIVTMIKGSDHWLIQDSKGKLWKMMEDSMEVTELMHFHSGKIKDLSYNSQQNALVSIGEDGQTKLWDFIRNREYYSR